MTQEINRIEPVDNTLDPEPLEELAGNHQDDDGVALDDQLQYTGWEPLDYEGVDTEKESIPSTNRLLHSRANLQNVFTAVQMLPADPNRIHLRIQELTGASGMAFYSSESFDIPLDVVGGIPSVLPAAAGAVNLSTSPLVIDDFTGALWMASTVEDNPYIVEVTAVTK